MALPQVAPARAHLARIATLIDDTDDALLELYEMMKRPELRGVSHARMRNMMAEKIAPMMRQLKIEAATAPHSK